MSIGLLGCTTGQKAKAVDVVLDGEGRRKESFEATLRVLDDNPTYVDEFFVIARKHPKTLDRFIANAARDLKREELAKITARHLAKNPDSLKQVLVQTMDAAKASPEARAAIAAAIEERAALASEIMADKPSAMQASFEAMVDAIADRPEARAAFLQSMQRTSPEIAQLLANNPSTLKAMTKAMFRVGMQHAKAEMTSLLDELKR